MRPLSWPMNQLWAAAKSVPASIYISFTALIVSISGLYIQYIYESQVVHVVIANHDFAGEGRVSFDIVVANGGNQTVGLTNVRLVVYQDPMPEPEGSLYEYRVSGRTVALAPQEIDVLELCVGIPDIPEFISDEVNLKLLIILDVVFPNGKLFESSVVSAIIYQSTALTITPSETRRAIGYFGYKGSLEIIENSRLISAEEMHGHIEFQKVQEQETMSEWMRARREELVEYSRKVGCVEDNG